MNFVARVVYGVFRRIGGFYVANITGRRKIVKICVPGKIKTVWNVGGFGFEQSARARYCVADFYFYFVGCRYAYISKIFSGQIYFCFLTTGVDLTDCSVYFNFMNIML